MWLFIVLALTLTGEVFLEEVPQPEPKDAKKSEPEVSQEPKNEIAKGPEQQASNGPEASSSSDDPCQSKPNKAMEIFLRTTDKKPEKNALHASTMPSCVPAAVTLVREYLKQNGTHDCLPAIYRIGDPKTMSVEDYVRKMQAMDPHAQRAKEYASRASGYGCLDVQEEVKKDVRKDVEKKVDKTVGKDAEKTVGKHAKKEAGKDAKKEEWDTVCCFVVSQKDRSEILSRMQLSRGQKPKTIDNLASSVPKIV